MNRQKLIAAALFLPLFGFVLFQPPWISLFPADVSIGGVPLQIVYLFTVWLALIVFAVILNRSLVRRGSRLDEETEPGRDAPP